MSGVTKGSSDGVQPAEESPGVDVGDVAPAADGSAASTILVEWAFAPGSDAPGTARRLVTEALGDSSDAIDLVVLMVSELVTNAVLHTQQEAEFRLIDLGSEGLRAEVEDRDGHPPEPSEHPGAGGGYGLRIIDGFARSWGTSLLASGSERPGKIVWFEVDWQQVAN